jgi:hypothetical protein
MTAKKKVGASKSKGKRNGRVVIGAREKVALPAWDVKGVLAKVDTGARTSAIDVKDIEELGRGRVRFHLVVTRNKSHRTVAVEAAVIRRTRVKSSFGEAHERLVVRTLMRLGPVEKEIELSLVCRKDMLCRMLLGREALSPEFLIDCSHRSMWR